MIELIKGKIAPIFWSGVIILGIIIPITISVASYYVVEVSAPLLITGTTSHLIGAFALMYSLLKAGMYEPLLPITR